ncbi:MAG TPA: phospholipase D-like domain-containing protein [Alphaproteobacteria bacterium]|nr:phospholipase D-like domain-containing protein [Alphaproteobacteria bacterium]
MSDTTTPMNALAGSGFARVADAALSEGNAIELLRDGPENFPRWLDAIAKAERFVHLENYIFDDDRTGTAFADELIEAASRGVKCRVLYDWMGCRMRTHPAFWERLTDGGVEVRCYNPPHFGNPISWISRDHRKVLCVDGRIAFTGGLCIGDEWVGFPDKQVPPWRDTGLVVRGPAVAEIDAAFADSWKTTGPAIPAHEMAGRKPQKAGDLKAWVIAGRPDEMGLYRLAQLVAEIAEKSLWLTDAYFVGTTNYVRALTGAAEAGVDVRLLVPGSNDWPVVGTLSRAGYRPLLEAGVRVFEWNGPMLHAKTAVADGCWSRIGSSNSNLASWTSNRELDVTIQDSEFAARMMAMYEEDLENATEIVLKAGKVRRPKRSRSTKAVKKRKRYAGRSRLLAGTAGLGATVGAALTRHRALGSAESAVLAAGGLLVILLALAALLAPRLVAYPLALIGLWVGSALIARAWRTRRRR